MPKAQANATAADLSRIPRLDSQPSLGFTTARRRVQRCCTGHATAAFGAEGSIRPAAARSWLRPPETPRPALGNCHEEQPANNSATDSRGHPARERPGK